MLTSRNNMETGKADHSPRDLVWGQEGPGWLERESAQL